VGRNSDGGRVAWRPCGRQRSRLPQPEAASCGGELRDAFICPSQSPNRALSDSHDEVIVTILLDVDGELKKAVEDLDVRCSVQREGHGTK
jgi:hypothetical protein